MSYRGPNNWHVLSRAKLPACPIEDQTAGMSCRGPNSRHVLSRTKQSACPIEDQTVGLSNTVGITLT
ncbi:hypothetical protein Bpfe_012331 [Biomphalaria pfeifferi]|uniref:Uncharacterized protein n=1 Tax=Biomphalaria pfeifferi TaxID=112525 RepID=A0AAD8BPF3_BIOPF|nr:hypothetical protein Bpfe_012331 [Biomphalaria pfeifferi]